MAKDEPPKILMDILGFNQEQKRELEKRFGRSAKTWDEVIGWDDCVIPEEKAIIEELKKQAGGNCPYLGTKGKYFNFCEVKTKMHEELGYAREDSPSPSDAQYQSKVGHFELQLWCMDSERFYNCMDYQKEQSR